MSNTDPKAFKSLNSRQVKKLLESGTWKRNEELINYVSTFNPGIVYQNSEDQVLYTVLLGTEFWGVFYGSTDLFLKHQTDIEALSRGRGSFANHILTGDHFPYGEEFLKQIPTLIAQLADLLSIPSERLDYSLSSLDRAYNTLLKTQNGNLYRAPAYASLLAYLGEVIRRVIHGEWHIHYIAEFQIWEPFVKDSEGRVIRPDFVLQEAFDPGTEEMIGAESLSAAAETAIAFRKPL
jgi:hypothetical protein